MKFPNFLMILVLLVFSCSTDGMNEDEVATTDDEGNTGVIDVSANRRAVGDSANDMLADANFQNMVFELFYVEGMEPTSVTIQNFEDFLSERLNKSGEITITLTQIESRNQSTYTLTDIRNIEDTIRTEYNDGDTVAVFGLFIDGEYSENTDNGTVLGVAYRNTSFVVFEESIQSFSGQPFAPSTTVLESTVLNHEFGHLLGLVNAGTPLQSDHQDVENGRHCTVDDCLMFWTAETGEGLINMISGGSIPSLDSQCIADLQANGGK